MAFNGERIVVLGGSSGIGLATAQAAAREGATVVIASSRKARIDEALATLPAGTEGHVLDLADGDATQALFARLGSFDHLVFTAGETLQLGSLATTDMDAARRFFALRYWGAYYAAKYGSSNIRQGRLDRVHFRHRGAAAAGGLVARCKHLRGDGGTDTRARSRARSHSRQHRLARRCANATVGEHGRSRPSGTVSTNG